MKSWVKQNRYIKSEKKWRYGKINPIKRALQPKPKTLSGKNSIKHGIKLN